MIESPKFEAQKVTKPIQLLAAWLVGLMAIDGMFLGAASRITGWEQSVLVIAAVFNVPLFLGAIFLLQTKFRPELQEDSYYATYLNSKTNTFYSGVIYLACSALLGAVLILMVKHSSKAEKL